jgi:hypothetical protein
MRTSLQSKNEDIRKIADTLGVGRTGVCAPSNLSVVSLISTQRRWPDRE